MINIIAKIRVGKDNLEEFLKVAKVLVEKSKEEEGNISYELFKDIEDSEIYSFIEEWKSLEAIEFHKEAKHFKENIKKIIELSKTIEANKYSQVV
ncbi:MAG: antibiotic biosynthesis monooxygenase [Psychrilyobacter sp.]|nr:antibiotic biosynthesis monooxygenase [Psychrilyobacter sp.]